MCSKSRRAVYSRPNHRDEHRTINISQNVSQFLEDDEERLAAPEALISHSTVRINDTELCGAKREDAERSELAVDWQDMLNKVSR